MLAGGLARRMGGGWLYPGMHLKRWLVLMVVGVTLLGLGAAVPDVGGAIAGCLEDWIRRR